jgi:hypothetical protein
MAAFVVNHVLMWFEDQEPEATESAVMDLARQFAALRVTTVTEAGRRLSRRLQNFRIQHLELQVRWLHWRVNHAADEVVSARIEGRRHMAMLRAMVLAYEPGDDVTAPLDFPGPAPRFGEFTVDMHSVNRALMDLGVGRRARSDLLFLAREMHYDR